MASRDQIAGAPDWCESGPLKFRGRSLASAKRDRTIAPLCRIVLFHSQGRRLRRRWPAGGAGAPVLGHSERVQPNDFVVGGSALVAACDSRRRAVIGRQFHGGPLDRVDGIVAIGTSEVQIGMGDSMTDSAVRQSDPGKSRVWALVPILCAAVVAVGLVVTGFGVAAVVVGTSGAIAGMVVVSAPPLKEWMTTRAADRRTAELAGIRTNIVDCSLDSLRVHRSDRDDTEFAPRDCGPRVSELLASGVPVLVEGASMAGKTRLVVQTLRNSGWREARLWFPTGDDGISELVKSGQDPASGTVVFLDDADRFLANGSLSLALLEKWLATKCVVVATMTAFEVWAVQG